MALGSSFGFAGSFIWYELMTPDPDAIAPFYAAVVGWTIKGADPGQSGGMDYRMIGRSDGKFAGGVLRLSADMQQHGARPLWLGYLSTPDVDAQLSAIVAEGGKAQMPATNLPNVGRIAMVTDPQGVPFYLMTPVPPPGVPDATSDVFDRHAPQHVNWNELASPDLAASKAFYSRRFGFEFNESMDMGPMGDYCFIDHHGQRVGAVTQRQDERQPAVWLFYIGVPSIAAATRAIEANGGKVLMGPHEVPTGEWIVIATDPAGAGFGLTGPKGGEQTTIRPFRCGEERADTLRAFHTVEHRVQVGTRRVRRHRQDSLLGRMIAEIAEGYFSVFDSAELVRGFGSPT